MTYEMRTPNSCGPDALGFAVNTLNPLIMQGAVDAAWRIDNIHKFSDIGDTPLNHFAALERLGVPHELIGSSAILRGRGVNNQTVILIHDALEDPEVRSLFSMLAVTWRKNFSEHWIVFEGVRDIQGHVFIRFHFGDGSIRQMGQDQFQKVFNAGAVRCAYVVGRGRRKVSWWAKLWGRITGKFY